LRDWPTTVQKLSLKVSAGGTPVTIKPTLDPRLAELWKAVFSPTTPVTPFLVPDWTDKFVLSYPAAQLGTALLLGHVGLAQTADQGIPTVENLSKVFLPLVNPATSSKVGAFDPNRAVEQVKSKHERGAVVFAPGSDPIAATREAIFLGRAFHGVRNPKKSDLSGKKTLDDLDFHGIVGQLGEYPELLEKLGLIFEVTLSPGAAAEVFVEPVWAAGAPAVLAVSPRTQVSPAFWPAGDPSTLDGFMNLKAGFAVSNFDIDAALHQTVSLAESLLAMSRKPAMDTPGVTGVAPLRSSGLSLLQVNRAFLLKNKLNWANLNRSNPTPALSAAMLNRGWRVDVRDVSAGKNSPWRSLCQRVGEYAFPKSPGTAPLSGVKDEGVVRTAASEQPGHPEIYLHESLFTWDGWSLCAPRPTKPVPNEGEVPTPTRPQPVRTEFTAQEGTLPRLRYGRLYQFRLRSVDLSGGGRAAGEAGGEAEASVPVPYGRYEPVAPPVVILQSLPGAGESAERLVVRSLGPGQPVGPPSVRHLAPPRVSVDMALAHGVLDDASGKPDPAKLPMIHARDGDFARVKLPDVFQPGDRSRDSEVILVPDAEAKIPYLPDPLCVGGVLVGDAGFGNLPFNTGAWPEFSTFRLRLVEGPRSTKVEGREIVVSLPKAERATFRLASLIPSEALSRLGLWQWIETARVNGQLPAAKYEALKKLALSGSHWMLTPNRTITLVNAVWQPLEAPKIESLSVRRLLSSPGFQMPGVIVCDAKSTGQLDVQATWDDLLDDASKPIGTVTKIPGKTHLFALPLRFVGELVPVSGPNVAVKGTDGKSIASWEPTGKRVSFTEGVLGKDGDPPLAILPDTRYRRIRCKAVASTRFREYFLPEQVAGTLGTQESAEAIVDVPSATPPAPPVVALVVPTFGWERTASQSRRRCGLRVYLERPWFSSGDGELLAVVCASGTPSDVLMPHVTQLGSDPLWLGAGQPRFPTPGKFTSRLPFTEGDAESAPGTRLAPKDFKTTSLPLYGVETAEKAQIAAFAVQPDPVSGLWTAEIEIETGASYFPFVRLALARYQPRSVAGAHLSPVVLADFAQLLPERFLTVNKAAGGVVVSVSGPAPASSVFEASIERLAPEAGDLEWQAVGSPVTLTTNTAAITARTGTLTLPTAVAGKLRVAIREWEVYSNGRRLVYAENWPV
jgi:hypothetical protein